MPVTPPAQPIGGGIPARWMLRLGNRARTKEEIRADRERFGIVAAQVIAAVATSQAERLEQDEQKRFDELLRELELREIKWDTRYLEALNRLRELMIDEEIARLLKLKIEEELMVLMLVAACV